MKKYLFNFVTIAMFFGLVSLTPIAMVDAQTPAPDRTVQGGLDSIKDSFPDTVVADDAKLSDLIKKIMEYALYFAGVIAVLFIIYGGYQYIFSGGADDRAKAGRKTLGNAIIGLIIVVLAYIIIQIVYRFITTT